MELAIGERITLLNILPAKGDIIMLRVSAELREGLSFSEKELADGKITQDADGHIAWDASAELVKDVTIGDAAQGIIKDVLSKLNEDKELTPPLVPIWDKFMG